MISYILHAPHWAKFLGDSEVIHKRDTEAKTVSNKAKKLSSQKDRDFLTSFEFKTKINAYFLTLTVPHQLYFKHKFKD